MMKKAKVFLLFYLFTPNGLCPTAPDGHFQNQIG